MKNFLCNPYLPSWEYIPDGEPRVFGDRLYIFGSHDRFGGNEFCENDYVCWSAPVEDLSDWQYEGVIYRKDQEPLYKGNGCLYAPDVIQGPDGRYYLYYSMGNSSVVSVAVCDTPAGHYSYYGFVSADGDRPMGLGIDDMFMFDPAVFVDDDGRIYLYSGFKVPFLRRFGAIGNDGKEIGKRKALGPYVVELDRDMKTVIQGPKLVLERKLRLGFHNFFEAASLRKYDGVYYLIYSSNICHELCYATCDRPDGIFECQGVLYSNINGGFPGIKGFDGPIGNNHGSIVRINNIYYIFGHRQTNQNGHTRQGIADMITKEGLKFNQAEYTSQGLRGAPFSGTGTYPAYMACCFRNEKNKKCLPYPTQERPDITPGAEETTQYISGIFDGSMVGYTYFSFENTTSVKLKVRGNGCGRISVSLDRGKSFVGSHSVDFYASTWQTISVPVNISAGISGLYFVYTGTGTLDLLEFTLS